MKANILGRKVKIKEINGLTHQGESLSGLWNADKGMIFIDIPSASTTEMWVEICFHEIFHGIIERIGLDGYLDEKVEEVIVSSMAKAVSENLHLLEE